MTNLTSEQYRDVIKHVPNITEEIPSVQHLLRRAVETFHKRFGAYPELSGVAPGKIGLFGDQMQRDDGMAMTMAIPMATIVVGRKAAGDRFAVVTSADVGKPHKVKFSFSRNRPLGPGYPTWLNYVKGVIDNYEEDVVPPFEAAIESSVPIGVGLGSTSAIEVATYSFLEVLVGKKSDPIDKAKACQKAESFAGQEVGLVDRITSILAKDRHAMIIDCKTNDVQWVPFKNPEVSFVIVDLYLKDTVFEDEYPERTKYWAKACKILGVDSLRDCTEVNLTELENRVNEILENEQLQEEEAIGEDNETRSDVWTKEEYSEMIKRTRFFITEMKRITEAVDAWNDGDVESFGEKMKESHESLKEDLGFNNPVLDFFVQSSFQVEGVLGSKMTGMGLKLGGTIISIMYKQSVENYCEYISEKFAEFESQLSHDLEEAQQIEKKRQHEIKNKQHSGYFDPAIVSPEKIERIQENVESNNEIKKVSPRKLCSAEYKPCLKRKVSPCIIKVEGKKGGCGTWTKNEKKRSKEFFQQKSLEGEKTPSVVSEIPDIKLSSPTFYLVSPFAGARMLFVTKTDILRSLYAQYLPDPKALLRSSWEVLKTHYGNKLEAVGFAPATVSLFGEFMEFHLGYIISMALPIFTIVVGGRNDTTYFSFKTLSEKVEKPLEMKSPLPCVSNIKMESRSWVNYVMGTVKVFEGHVPGFNAVINSSVPIRIGVNSCAALLASVYTFLENLTREGTSDMFEKANKCNRTEYEFFPTPKELITACSPLKFFPIFFCKEGHLMFVHCRRRYISQYFFDNPAYVFLIGSCKENTSDITVNTLEERFKQSKKAAQILEKDSLLNLDLKHLRCLRKLDASEEMIKRVKYIITEHERTIEAIKAIKNEDYARVGLLMNQSHASLRDDYEVSSPQIENLIRLALSAEGVLGAKMVGNGLFATILILIRLEDADNCIRYIRRNYEPKTDKPIFYIVKPSQGAYMINPEDVSTPIP